MNDAFDFCEDMRDGLTAMRAQLHKDCDEIDFYHSVKRERCDEGYAESQTDYNKLLRRRNSDEQIHGGF